MNIVIGVLVMILCLVLQAVIARMAILYYGRQQETITKVSAASSLLVIIWIMMLLLAGNFIQIAIWALLFQTLGEFELYADAFYHSAVNFATLGYGDLVMSEAHRILGPLEAVNGVLMIGVSTAVLMASLQDALARRLGVSGRL